MQNLFITGTDTGVGKTLVTCAMLSKLRQQGLRVQGMKPVASGCRQTPEGLRNEDAEMLIRHSSLELDYATVNPYAYHDAVAPHLLAEEQGETIDFELIRRNFLRIAAQSDCTLVEGVGGWMVPLNATQTVADLAIYLDLPVVLVVGMRLGCINHALLSYQAILDSGLSCVGWVANQIEDGMPRFDENISTIRRYLDVPLLATIPYAEAVTVEHVSTFLDSW